MPDYAERLIVRAFETGVLAADPATGTTGIDLPVYFNAREWEQCDADRALVVDALSYLTDREQVPCEGYAGVPDAGCWIARACADRHGVPYTALEKDPALATGFRTTLPFGDTYHRHEVVVVENAVTTGTSAARAAKTLRFRDGTVRFVATLFDYGIEHAIHELVPRCRLVHVADYEDLVDIGTAHGFLSGAQADALRAWKRTKIVSSGK